MIIIFSDSREFSSRFLHPSCGDALCGDACHVSFLLLMDLLILMLREENPQAKKVVNSRGPAVPTASMLLSVLISFGDAPEFSSCAFLEAFYHTLALYHGLSVVILTLVSKLITTMWSLLVGPRGGKPRPPELLRSANSKSVGGSKSRVRAGGRSITQNEMALAHGLSVVTLTLVSKLITTMWSLLVGPRGDKSRPPLSVLITFGDAPEFSSRFLHPSCGDACHVSVFLLMDC